MWKYLRTPPIVANILMTVETWSVLLIHFKFPDNKRVVISHRVAGTQSATSFLFAWIWSSVNKSQSGISRSRRCLPFLLSAFVTNFNNIWHSINFSLLKDTRLRLNFSPSNVLKCHESCRGRMDWRLTGNEVYKWVPCFSCSFAQIEKNKSMKWAAGSLLLSFQSFSAADLFTNMHFPCVTDTQNNLLNGMQNLTFAAFWLPFWLVSH